MARVGLRKSLAAEIFELSCAASSLSFPVQRPHADQSARSAAMPRQRACRDEMASRALASVRNQVIVPEALPVGRGEHRIDPSALVGLTSIIAPCGLADILVKVLRRNPVVDAVNLPFQQRPEALDRVCVRVVPGVLALGVLDDRVGVFGVQSAIANPLVRDQQPGLLRDVRSHEAFQGRAIDAADWRGNHLAATRDGADDGYLAGTDATPAAALRCPDRARYR